MSDVVIKPGITIPAGELAFAFARSGGGDSLPYLESLSTDSDSEVAQEGVRSLRTLRARLP